jgi:hypothetical protein
MRLVFLLLGALLGATTASCGEDGPDCDCAEAGCFADTCTKTAFVLAAPVPAKLGGLAGADMLCAQQAAAAGLPGSFRAWLSDANSGPFDRFSRATVPYVLPDGKPIADDWEDLRLMGPSLPIDMTAAGVTLDAANDARVWSGSGPDGRSEDFNGASNFCSGWSRSSIDDFTYVGKLRERGNKSDWTMGSFLPCTGDGLLYCFQQ